MPRVPSSCVCNLRSPCATFQSVLNQIEEKDFFLFIARSVLRGVGRKEHPTVWFPADIRRKMATLVGKFMNQQMFANCYWFSESEEGLGRIRS